MAEKVSKLTEKHKLFIGNQKIFFVGTAGAEGTVNVSPKGMDSLRVLDDNTVIWLNLTGSGNETAAHVQQNGRMTLMFCAFEGKPLILRIYGNAKTFHERDKGWDRYRSLFAEQVGARQVFEVRVELVQTSCGFAVPLYDYMADRELPTNWAAKKGREGVKEYWKEKNVVSLDGHRINILEDA